MKLLSHLLLLALAVAWVHCEEDASAALDRCKGMEMDAVTVNEKGVPYFFKGDHLFRGFNGKAEWSNASFAEMDDDHSLGHVDAAFFLNDDANRSFFFLDNKVFSYYQQKLEAGYPKDISEEFPGIPDNLDAAVECPKPECDEKSVIFFKGNKIYSYNIKTKAVEEKEFSSMPACTSALRFMESYFCFHGTVFSKFDPKTGEVQTRYPQEARGVFMKCEFGAEGDHVERERCSRVDLDAVSSDQQGNMFAFRDHYYFYKAEGNDTITAKLIDGDFKEVHSNVDAVFSHEDHLHVMKGDKVFVYKVGESTSLLAGYPKTVKEDLGIDGPINAAFMCEDTSVAYVIKDNKIYDVDMNALPRVATNARPINHLGQINAAMCNSEGVTMISGNYFYRYESVRLMVAARIMPKKYRLAQELFGCDH